MKKNIIKKALVMLAIITIIVISSGNINAITPDQITGSETEIEELKFIDNVTDLVRTVGSFIAVGALMVIGIRYMMGSTEERASYKKSMMPYIIGCFILFGAANIAPQFKDLFSNMGNTTEDIGNKILGLIQVIGTFISVGGLMILGIRYMMGSTEERASYKKSMLPYIIGAVLLFAAVNITTIIYNVSTEASASKASTTQTHIQKPGGSNKSGGVIVLPQ